MMHLPKSTGPVCRLLLSWVRFACLGLAVSWVGCGPSQSRPGDVPEAPGRGPAPDAAARKRPIPQGPAVEKEPATAEGVLESMVAAYKKASSYADAGTVRLLIEQGEGKVDESADYALTLVRPAKIRMQVYQAMVVCDGQELHAAIADLPGQVLAKAAPDELTMESIYADGVLAAVLSSGLTGPAPQLILLLEDDPLGLLLQDVEETSLGQPGTISGRDCHRVELRRASGTMVFWVDRESYALRRIVFPTDELRKEISGGGPVDQGLRASLVAEFAGAEFDVQVDARAFAFEVPEGAELVKFFAPPDPAQLLAKRVPDFKFVDLEGNLVTPDSLAGKITVLEFWSTTCKYCRDTLPGVDKARQQYKDHDQVGFFAVSVDDPEVENGSLQGALEQLGVDLAILRDPQRNMGMLFNTTATPAEFLIDAKGVVQFYEVGVPQGADLAAALSEKLEKLLAGEDIYQKPLQEYQQRLKEYERQLEASADSRSPGRPAVEEIEIPRAEIAQRSEPKTFNLSRLWDCTELTAPGNVLVVESAGGQSRLLVVDANKSVAEVGPDGKLITMQQLPIEPSEAISNLRTAAGADGRRYFAAFSFAQQRFHLFDQSWQLIFSFPQDALENHHPGIADVQLADLDGDGRIEAYVGYRDVVGVQRVSLEGKRLWSNRSVIDVAQIAFSGPDAQGARHLACTSRSGALTKIDSAGRRLGEVSLLGRFLHRIVAADLDGDGVPQWCGMAVQEDGRNVAVGLSEAGKESFSYELPVGVHRRQIEPIVAGRLLPGAAGQWLLPGADGSIHVVAGDGKLLDRFNYGAELAGLATTELDGKRLLIVATPDALEAWRVE